MIEMHNWMFVCSDMVEESIVGSLGGGSSDWSVLVGLLKLVASTKLEVLEVTESVSGTVVT